MCSPIPITSPLLEDNGHPIPTKTPTPFSKPFYSIFSDHSHLCLPLSSSAMAALFHPRSLRRAALLAGALNLAIIALGTSLFPVSLRRCGGREKSAVAGAVAAAALRIGSMLRAGIAQGHAAVSIATAAAGGRRVEDAGDDSRHRRRRRYRRWLWWTRFGMFVNALQFVMALYLMYIIMKDFARDGGDNVCFLGHQREDTGKKFLMATFLALVWLVVVIQCITGSDVLRWRSFYATQDSAWKVHYSEVFDHGIREALCCLGRVKYLSVLEEDEVFSVARLLGDLVAYRATGTGHLELLAGLALLQSHKQPTKSYNEDMEAPLARIQEARVLHQFAEAAYTGPLLDFGRNTVLFPCSWLYRQGVLTPWTHNRRPILEGDNWWRGHAAAFLKCANLSPQALQRGRVIQVRSHFVFFFSSYCLPSIKKLNVFKLISWMSD
ncbi:sn1-specific diacylglycerol lipase [Dendrobium catenatum]|uniref:Sn1-specific diacylglycerol lipase n=1 Tax=Dendrobium catenatum TaxID=906689 RepID=A0A2I0WP60_9ASPA|nr:sn1-specific diacylglycerol lipase [Dendrobium catenatum]